MLALYFSAPVRKVTAGANKIVTDCRHYSAKVGVQYIKTLRFSSPQKTKIKFKSIQGLYKLNTGDDISKTDVSH